MINIIYFKKTKKKIVYYLIYLKYFYIVIYLFKIFIFNF